MEIYLFFVGFLYIFDLLYIYFFTSIPIDRAEPQIIFVASSKSWEFKSFIFYFAIFSALNSFGFNVKLVPFCSVNPSSSHELLYQGIPGRPPRGKV